VILSSRSPSTCLLDWRKRFERRSSSDWNEYAHYLARGLVIVVVAFLFFAWLVPDRSQPEWVRGAKSRVVLQGTGDWLMSMLPDDPESTILKRLKKPKPEEEEPQQGQRSSLDQSNETLAKPVSSGTRTRPSRN
jgi:membrane protein required for colicin V production